MDANEKSSAEKPAETTMAFRHLLTRRRMLEVIATERGHITGQGDPVLTPVLREAVDEFIDRHLLRKDREKVPA